MFLTCLIISYQKRFLCSFFFDVLCVVDVVVAGEIVTSRFNPFSARVKNIYNIHSSCGQSSLEVRPTCSRLNKHSTNCQKLLFCCQSGEISPNLAIMVGGDTVVVIQNQQYQILSGVQATTKYNNVHVCGVIIVIKLNRKINCNF